jgi:hypothetical protein
MKFKKQLFFNIFSNTINVKIYKVLRDKLNSSLILAQISFFLSFFQCNHFETLHNQCSTKFQIDHFSASGMYSELVNQLIGARARGARAVLLWTCPEHTQAVMQAIAQEIDNGSLQREDLFWLVVSPKGQASQILHKFGNALGGALIFR